MIETDLEAPVPYYIVLPYRQAVRRLIPRGEAIFDQLKTLEYIYATPLSALRSRGPRSIPIHQDLELRLRMKAPTTRFVRWVRACGRLSEDYSEIFDSIGDGLETIRVPRDYGPQQALEFMRLQTARIIEVLRVTADQL
jgi:hypothetical protein